MSKERDLRKQPVAPPEASSSDPPAAEKAAETPAPAAVPPETKQSVQDVAAPEPRPTTAAVRRAPSHDFQLKALPTLTGVLMMACLWPQGIPNLIVDTISDYVWLPVHGSQLASRFANHTVMLLLALGMIRLMRRRRPEDFGLVMPRGRSYVATAIILGLFFGAVMAIVDYAPEIIARVAPHDSTFQLTNVFGWLFYQGVFVGPTEEIPYRGLVVTYLTLRMPGKLHYRGFEMNGAGVVVAAIFASGFGLPALITQPLFIAIGQILYVFFGNLALAYLLEKSGSVLAPAIGHNVALLTWKSLVFWMVTAWRS